MILIVPMFKHRTDSTISRSQQALKTEIQVMISDQADLLVGPTVDER